MNKLNPKYFGGALALDKELMEEQRQYLMAFSRTRRMKRDAELAKALPDPLREAVWLDIGEEGGYYVGGSTDDESILKHSIPPIEQPSINCKWEPSISGKSIVWAGNKFFGYIEWLEYLIEHFIEPWGREINGMIEIKNEADDVLGYIKVIKNKVEVKYEHKNR